MDNKLLIRYILGKANQKESEYIAEWIKESHENLEQFSFLKAQFTFSTMPNTIFQDRRKNFAYGMMRVAAILLVPLIAGIIYLYMANNKANDRYLEACRQTELLQEQHPGSVTYIANAGTKSLVVLPDSSIVRLNGESKLIVPQRFAADARELFLTGEGYFEVRHHDDWPMNVRTANGVTVKVLGTTFNLSAYEDDEKVKVTLIEGSIVVKEDKSNYEHKILPNQEINIDVNNSNARSASDMKLPKIKHADIYKNTGWVKGELIFDNTPMTDVIKQLERWYGVNIHVTDNDIMKYHFTATFTTESITRVLEYMKFSSKLKYDINGSDVYIQKAGS